MGNGSESAVRDGAAWEIPLLDEVCRAGALLEVLARVTGFGRKVAAPGEVRGSGRR